MVAILSYMEQDNLFKIYTNFGGNDSTGFRYAGGTNTGVSYQRLKTFTCPSDIVQTNFSVTTHNYVLNAGNTSFYQSNLPFGCTGGSTVGANGCVTFGGAPFGWYEDPATQAAGGDASPVNYSTGDPKTGMSGKPRRMTSITDGTSNTLCTAEVIQGPSPGDYRGFSWWGGAAGFTTYQTPNNTTAPDVMTGAGCGSAATYTNPPMPCTTTSTSTLARMQLARSRHTGGVVVSLCDGSVRFMSNSISLVTWRSLGTSQGGETLGNDY
jgi:hypothetical protein